MADESKTGKWDDSQVPAPDPLGVIGWVIGGKYKVRSYIGGGGFGEVYDGFNTHLPEQRLVIKFFKRVQAREKFEKEAKILCLLEHPHISRVIDFLPDEGALVIAFIDGIDGGQILKEKGALAEQMFLNVARSITSALAYAHSKKIANRDVKPDNILVDRNGHVYLIDFGIAKVMRENATKTAYQALTPMFAAPERQTGMADYNPFLSDIYEIGVTLFNLVTKEMPYRNPTNPDLSEWGGPAAKKLSPQLKRILMKATHPDPSRRYQTVAELHEELQHLEVVYWRRNLTPWLVAAGLVVVAAAGFFLLKDKFTGVSNTGSQTVAEKEQNQAPDTSPAKKPVVTADSAKQAVETAVKPPEAKPDPARQDTVPLKPASGMAATTPATEPKPAVEVLPTILVKVIPDYNVALLIDGVQRSQNKNYQISKGRHEITVMQPDYPIYVDNIDLEVDRTLRYDLAQIYANSESQSFRIGVIPADIKGGSLQVSFNGGARSYNADNIPVLDLNKPAGKWQVAFKFLNAQGRTMENARIDSVVTFPYGGGPHTKMAGSQAVVDFGAERWKGLSSIDLLIFWTQK